MRGPLLWAGGLIGSLAAHGVAFAFLNLSVEPDPTPTQPKPETQLSMDAYQVKRQEAQEQKAPSEDAAQTDGETTDVAQGAIPQSRSEAQAPEAQKLTDTAPDTPAAAAQAPSADTLQEASSQTQSIAATSAPTQALQQTTVATETFAPSPAPESAAVSAIDASVETIASVSATATPLLQTAMSQDAVAPSQTPTQNAALSAPDAQSAAPQDPDAQAAALQNPDTKAADQSVPDVEVAANPRAPSEQTNPQNPDAPAAQQQPLPAEFAKASLAWNFGDRVVTDPDAIATIQAFMAPQAIDGSEQVRDGLSALLTSVDCARLSATFIPETGALELRGHVPDNALRAPVLKALQDQIGEGITVTDNLRHLPKPQCGALTGIADVGLPQSTDQLTNKRLIGDNAQAVEYTYSEGQPLGFDLTAPDYDAVVYVDYFDADGQVIHLVPNEVVALQAYKAKQVVGIERGEGPKLNITIGPPFGQEIAVAFAASRPLFSELRPLIEPAEPYLEFLKAKVAEARDIDPDFKGEWVYFFITTQPATQ